MTAKKNNPNKGPAQTRAAGGAKKPYATLDLDAREVNPQGNDSGNPVQGSQSGKDSQTASSRPESKTSAEAGKADKPETVKTGNPSGASAGKSSVSAKADSTNAKGEREKTTSAKKAEPSKVSGRNRMGLGRLISHMAAGVVGGGLALLGGETIVSKLGDLGVPVSNARVELSKTTADLEQRMLAMESIVAASNSGDLASLQAQLTTAEAKLTELATVLATVSSLEAKQQKLIGDVAAVEARAVPSDSLGPIVDVVAGLEKQLATIEAATGPGRSRKGLAKLTALAGKLVDLEATFNHQLETLRTSVGKDIDTRIESISQASEAAKTGTTRIDRQLTSVTSEAAQLMQRVELLKADNDRLTSSTQVALEETAKVQSALEAFKVEYSKTISRLATRSDVDTSVGTVSTTITDLKTKVAEVVLAEKNRKANAQRIVLSLELSSLKRALDRGGSFEAELANVKNASNGNLDLSQLESFQIEGVPTLSSLKSSFRPVANAIIEADRKPTDGSVIDQFLAGARSIVKIRKVDHAPNNNSTEAVVGRIEKALAAEQVDQVIELSKILSAQAQEPAIDWFSKVEARRTVGLAVREIESQLKTSLSGGSHKSATSIKAN